MRNWMLPPLGLLLVALAGESPAADAPPSVPPAPTDSVAEAVIARQSAEFAQLFPLITENARLAQSLTGVPSDGGALKPISPAQRTPERDAARAREVRATQAALNKLLQDARREKLSTAAPARSVSATAAVSSAFAALHQARFEALSALAQIKVLAERSRLYASETDAASGGVFALGSAAVTKDYLSRQLSRVAVLCDHAAPYLTFLDNCSAVTAATAEEDRLPVYWKNTRNELLRATQGQDPHGAVGRLESLFLDVLVDLTPENRVERLAQLPMNDEMSGLDLFSERRRQLLQRAREFGGGKP